MSAIVTDTHAAIWYLLAPEKLSSAATAAFDGATQNGEPIYLPSICYIEVVYLVEKRKLPQVALERLDAVLEQPNSAFVLTPLDQGVAQTIAQISRDNVPDMPDRIIAATALHLGLPLITRDSRIQATQIQTIW